MKAEVVTDPADFFRRTRRLLADEARHNRIRGYIGNLVESPQDYPGYRLYLVAAGAEARAAALATPPAPLVLGEVVDAAALQRLVAVIRQDGPAVSGVNGLRPTVDTFVGLWCEATGDAAELLMTNGVCALEEVTPPRPPQGSARIATSEDGPLIEAWLHEFSAEALPQEPLDEAELRRSVAHRLRDGFTGAYWLWEVGVLPVSLSGHGSPTGSGIRVGPVYTPPEHRRQGYAAALVAAESQWLVDHGFRTCFLYTDLTNPTSNAIYERIGYRRVADAATYRFVATGS